MFLSPTLLEQTPSAPELRLSGIKLSSYVCPPAPDTFFRTETLNLGWYTVFSHEQDMRNSRTSSQDLNFPHARPGPGPIQHSSPKSHTYSQGFSFLRVDLEEREGHYSAGEKDTLGSRILRAEAATGSHPGHRQLVAQNQAIWKRLSSGHQAQIIAWLKQVGEQRVGKGLEKRFWEKELDIWMLIHSFTN